MAEVAPPAAPAPAGKVQKKKSNTPRKTPGHSARDLILKVVAASTERKGISYVSIKKGVAAEGYDVEQNRARFKRVFKKLVESGKLVQVSGTGVSGSFKAAKVAAKKEKKDTRVKKSTTVGKKSSTGAKKPTTGARKPATAGKPRPKTTPRKRPANKQSVKTTGAKSPKKAGKPGGGKKASAARKPGTPKKDGKKAGKTAVKKAAKKPTKKVARRVEKPKAKKAGKKAAKK